MGLYRDENGLVFEADDRFAHTLGYEPVGAAEEQDIYAQRGLAARADDRGVVGSINAAATGLASGATLGLSDVALGEILPDYERERLLGELEAHPYLRTGGEVVGAFGTAIAAPGSALGRTPTGYLSNLTAREMEAALAQGGVKGTAKALGYMGFEGAVQSGGQYIGHASLADTELTAEGLSGALGTGFAFGSLGGGAALGITKGAIAGRRMFSRMMSDAKGAESVWTQASQEALEADIATAQTAKARLEELRQAKAEALRYRNEARAMAREAGPAGETQVSQTSSAEPFVGPEPLTDIGPAQGGMPTSVFKRPEPVTFDATAAREFDARLPTHEGPEPLIDVQRPSSGQVTSVRGPTTKRIERPAAVSEPQTELEKALAATQEKIAGGAALRDIPSPTGRKLDPSSTTSMDARAIEALFAEDRATAALRAKLAGEVPKTDPVAAAAAARHQDSLHKLPDFGEQVSYPRRQPFANLRQQLTKQLLGKPMADIETELTAALDEFESARKDFLDLATKDFSFTMPGERKVPSDFLEPDRGGGVSGTVIAEVRAQGKSKAMQADTFVGRNKVIEALDSAHEEALLRAREAAHPREAGEALYHAEELEKLLERVSARAEDPSPGVPMDFASEMERGARIIDRYEAAAARLAETVGDGAHPISTEKGKAYAKANDEAVRKATDRATRAVDDAEMFGPMPKTAKEIRNEADRAFADRSADVSEAQSAYRTAKEKVTAGKQAKREALRVDAKTARTAGAPELGGVLEILDLPGLPKPSDLPVVGPLLGAWLKYRTIKAALGRRMGRYPATANNRVAALAARTQDRIARAVDRSLGLMSRGGKYSSRIVPPVAGILANRLYDDGLESPKKGAPVGELAAARIRELAAYVHSPDAIERDVRRELRDVTDPDIILAAEKHRRAAMEYLLSVAPKAPEQALLNTIKWQPSPAQALSFGRSMEAVGDPAAAYERLEHEQQMISLEAAEALRKVYPQLFSQAQQRVVERIAEMNKPIPYRTRVQMTMLYKLPFDAALSADNLMISQSVYERKPSSPAYMPAAAPAAAPPTATPSIANPVDLSQAYTPPTDRMR